MSPVTRLPWLQGVRALALAVVLGAASPALAQALTVTLRASPPVGSPGSVVRLDLAVTASVPVAAVEASLELPPGLRVVPASTALDGAPTSAPLAQLPLGDLAAGQTRLVSAEVTVLFGAGNQRVQARARGTLPGGTPVEATPADALVVLRGGDLAAQGGVFGRVCYDVRPDGRCTADEPAAPWSVVFLEDGSHAQADELGRFHLSPVLPGRHVLLAGPGPLSLGLRTGSFPALPRRGSAKATTLVLAGHYAAVDLALPAPADLETEVADRSQEEGLPSVYRSSTRASNSQPPGGAGAQVGFAPADPAPTSARLHPYEDGRPPTQPYSPPAKAPERVVVEPGPGPNPRASTAVIGLAEGLLQLDTSRGLRSARLVPSGRLALTLQDDFGDLGRATFVIDTAREDRARTGLLLDPSAGYSEFGDDGRVALSTEEKLFIRLDTPELSLQVGRAATDLSDNELLYLDKSFLGAQAAVGSRLIEARLFAGFAADPQHVEEFAGRDDTGPFQLARAPMLSGSEQVDVELRSPTGQVLQRVALRRGADYFLDPARARLELSRPLPPADLARNTAVLVVRYQSLAAQSTLTNFLGGARVQLGTQQRRVGLTVLHQSDQGQSLATVDAAFKLGRLTLEGAAGAIPVGQARLADRAAGRARVGLQLTQGLGLFAFGAGQGDRWEPTVRSRSLPTPALMPFATLDAQRLYPQPLPALQLLRHEPEFPFLLEERAGHVEVGAGLWARAGAVRGLSLYRAGRDLTTGAGRESAELAVEGVAGSARVYGGHASSAGAGELLGPLAQLRHRQSVLGLQGVRGNFAGELDYRHLLSQDALGSTALHDLSVRTRYARWSALQPSLLLSATSASGAAASGSSRAVALGLESAPSANLHAFAYALLGDASGRGLPVRRSAYAGFLYAPGEAGHLSLRYDLRNLGTGFAHALAWDGRYRLGDHLTLRASGELELADTPRARLVRFAAAWVPPGRFRLLARLDEDFLPSTELSTWTRTAGLDAGLQLLPALRLEGKYLFRWERLGATRSVAQVVGLGARTELGRHFDVVAGGRHLRDASGGSAGGFFELGWTARRVLRVGVGVNVAARPETFTVTQQSPGVYLTLTGMEAGPLGAQPPEPVEEPTPVVVAQKKPTGPRDDLPMPPPPTPPRTKPTEAVSAVARLSGQIFGDRNGDGRADPKDEPVLDGVRLRIGEANLKTDGEGRYALDAVARTTPVEFKDALPFTYLPVQIVERQEPSERVVDFVLPKPKGQLVLGEPFRLTLPDGAPAKGLPLKSATFPLVAWAAGLPLSAQESKQIALLSEEVMNAPDLRLVVLVHAQSTGALKGAVKRAWKGARLFKRYLQATQTVPGSRVLIGLLEPDPATPDPLGHVDLFLVKVQK